MSRYTWVVDNRMRWYGEVDPNKRLIRINVAKHRRNGESLIDTLVHEELHVLFPRYGEERICMLTNLKLKIMSKAEKNRLYRHLHRGTARNGLRFSRAAPGAAPRRLRPTH